MHYDFYQCNKKTNKQTSMDPLVTFHRPLWEPLHQRTFWHLYFWQADTGFVKNKVIFENTWFKPYWGIFACLIADIYVWMLPELESKDWNFHTCVGSWFPPKRQLCLCFEEWRRCHGLYTDPSPQASGNTPHLLSGTRWRFA